MAKAKTTGKIVLTLSKAEADTLATYLAEGYSFYRQPDPHGDLLGEILDVLGEAGAEENAFQVIKN